ncbi:hypothetical protein B0H21DRAFT_426577 [Amylocystis lapponica]|nr:hypothetical protein B0H21DRAFT_426577 [Amylocystis lapponica]
MSYPVSMGVLTQPTPARLILMPECLEYNGKYLIPFARLGYFRKEAYDEELGTRLWNWLENEVGLQVQ